MKKLVLITLTVFLATSYTTVLCQDNYQSAHSFAENNLANPANENESTWPLLSIGLNPAGFLMFGPSVHADVKLFGRTCLSGYFIYHSMGLLSEPMIFGDNPRLYGKNCWGVAVGIKQFLKPNDKGNSFYTSVFSGYSYNQATYHEGPPSEFTEKINSIVFAANAGYRWNLGERFYLASGIVGGFSYSNEDKYYATYMYNFETMLYDKKERLIEDYSGEIYPYLFVEVTLGIKL